MAEPPVILVVGGLDPSAGAGLLVDADTARDKGVLALGIAAAVTAQSSARFHRWRAVDASLVRDQIAAVVEDYRFAAVKVGMIASVANVQSVATLVDSLPGVPLVLDPVLASSTGGALARDTVTRALVTELVPRAALVTPNAAEAAALTGIADRGRAGMAAAARALVEQLGAGAAVVTGGDLAEARLPGRRGARGRGGAAAPVVTDAFFDARSGLQWLQGARVAPPGGAPSVRGTGCRFATAVACELARGGTVALAVRDAKRYVRRTLERRAGRVGKGAAQVIPPPVSRSRR